MKALLVDLLALLLRGTGLMLGLVATLFALAGWGGLANDQLDALNQFAPLWLGLGFSSLALSLSFPRGGQRWIAAGVALVAVIASAAQIAPELLSVRPSPPKSDSARQLKIVQFNLWESNGAPSETSKWLLAQKADVVLVEEAGGKAEPILKDLFKAYPYRASCRGRQWCDTWIFSRWPLKSQRGFYEDGTDLSGVWAVVAHPSGDFPVAAAHFVWPVPAGRWQAQSRMLVSELSRLPRENLIVAGDFNSAPWSFGLRRQDRSLKLDRVTHGLPTWPSGAFTRVMDAPFAFMAIDQVYAGSIWKAVEVKRGPVLGSDHRAVVVTLRRNGSY
ncbi:MAG TPA: endonuclease/exonuclease/phosphatase family protein [Caulobacter sp.]|nr:endonuclease/exonuclease/phosphatase family protein [Caulobacter sp.]